MKLADLLLDMPVAIQCHNAPDADALASGFALYCWFSSRGYNPYFFYGGRDALHKPSLRLMQQGLGIPLVFDPARKRWEGLLITVDCQYGSNNVQFVEATAVAVIDHHLPDRNLPRLSLVNPGLGSCSTLVWTMMREEGFVLGPELRKLAIALYYGLFSDTNGFSEVRHPVDLNMRDALSFHDPQMMIQEEPVLKQLFTSNLSLEDLDIAFTALHDIHIDKEKQYALIEAGPCDQNLLGFMSDLAVQVDGIDTVVAWTPLGEGWKFSVRSSGRLAKAIDVAAWLAADGAGNGGGHKEKGGGYILARTPEPGHDSALEFFRARMDAHAGAFTIFDCADPPQGCCENMQPYTKRDVMVGYVPSTNLFPAGTRVCLRMLEGDTVITAEEDIYIIIGTQGEGYFMHRAVFERKYEPVDASGAGYSPAIMPAYEPTVSSMTSADKISLLDRARLCRSRLDGIPVQARQLDSPAKVFPLWDKDNYLLAAPGDWLIMQGSDPRDLYVVKQEVFPLLYEKV